MSGILRERKKEGDKKPTRYFSKEQEKTVAKNLGGQRTKNSGATMFGGKGDAYVDNLLLLECKTKTSHSESMSIKKEWLLKLREENMLMNKKACVLAFNFGPDEPNYYIIDEKTFIDFLEFLKNN